MNKTNFEHMTGLRVTVNEYEWIEDMFNTANEHSKNMDEETFCKYFVDMGLLYYTKSLVNYEIQHGIDFTQIDNLHERIWVLETEENTISSDYYRSLCKVAVLAHNFEIGKLNDYILQKLGREEYERIVKRS